MRLQVHSQSGGFGAAVTGIDLAKPLSTDTARRLRRIWLDHQVLSFPDQPMEHGVLEGFARAFGDFGVDPYVAPVPDHEHILEVRREPTEKVSPFGAAWHSDWSFQGMPPSATILHAKVVPPVGGDTWYADGYAAYDALDLDSQSELEALTAIHSAARPYSNSGFLASGGNERSMTILPSDEALETQEHPMVRTHPETGRKTLWVNQVYTIGIKELDATGTKALLDRLFKHAVEERFLYKHQWAANMLTMWDNRSVQLCARGGYDGHRRVMHRLTVAGDVPY
jgi:taurine dioxygenase